MKTIQLTRGYVARVDDKDFVRVSQRKWYPLVGTRTVYAKTSGVNQVLLHRFILDITDRRVRVDHEDHNGLNCQRDNLRVCTQSLNLANRRKTNGASQYKGAYPTKSGRWFATIGINNRNRHLGTYDTEIEAALAYDAAARQHFGEFALTNF